MNRKNRTESARELQKQCAELRGDKCKLEADLKGMREISAKLESDRSACERIICILLTSGLITDIQLEAARELARR